MFATEDLSRLLQLLYSGRFTTERLHPFLVEAAGAVAICMAGADGTVCGCTRGAERVFDESGVIRLEDGKVKIPGESQQRILDGLIASACKGEGAVTQESSAHMETNGSGQLRLWSWGDSAGGAMLIAREHPLHPVKILVTPLSPAASTKSAQGVALIQFSDAAGGPKLRMAALASLYNLTPTEARLAALLLDGLEVREIAPRLGISLESTRFNLKRVLEKTGTHRQAELVRLMLSLPGR